jgi:uncharacterized protein
MALRLLLATAALAALTVSSVPAAGESPVALTLAPGEVLLEIEARGTSIVPAHQARLMVALTGRGATAAGARRSVQAEVERVTAAARRTGVAAGDIRFVEDDPSLGFLDTDVGAEPLLGSGSVPEERQARRMLTVLVRNPATASQVRDALEDAGQVAGPFYDAADEDIARRAARADALRRARADADALAAASGLRVARIVRISGGAESDPLRSALIRRMSGEQPSRAESTEVETEVQLTVDFALLPR